MKYKTYSIVGLVVLIVSGFVSAFSAPSDQAPRNENSAIKNGTITNEVIWWLYTNCTITNNVNKSFSCFTSGIAETGDATHMTTIYM